MSDIRDRLHEYASRLKAAGFSVWYAPVRPGHGYLTYSRDGMWGTFSESYIEGWQHYATLKPSREFGSSMFVEDAVKDPWTVEAAERAVRPEQWNHAVGMRPNIGKTGAEPWISPDAVAL